MAYRTGRWTALALAMVATAVLLAGCGDDDDGTEASSQGQSPTTAAATPTTAAGGGAATTTTAAAGTVVKTRTTGEYDTILTDSAGKSLYTFDRDTTEVSACVGTCAATWPALLLPAGSPTPIAAPPGVTGAFTTSARPDGTGNQVVWKGKPLYTYVADAAPGDVKGEGVGGVWHVAKL